VAGVRALHQQRQIQAGGPATDTQDPHVRHPPPARARDAPLTK
jgi:hypothetical protein